MANATVIDELVIELGLDPKKLTDGQRKLLEELGKTKGKAKKEAGSIEEGFDKVGASITRLGNRALGLFAIFVGAHGIKEFVTQLTKADAEAGRTAKIFDTSVRTLSLWRRVGIAAGGTAEGITQSIAGLVNQFQMFSLTGESSVIPWFRALGINISDADGKMRDFDAILLDLADKFSKLDPAKAAAFGRALGLDAGTINLLLQGRDAVAKMLEDQKKLGVATEESARASAALQKSWADIESSATAVGRTLLTGINPALVKAADSTANILSRFNRWLNSNDTWVDDFDKEYLGGYFTKMQEEARRKKGIEKLKEAAAAQTSSKRGAFTSAAEKEAFIRDEARKRGIDPDQAVRVAKSEGFFKYEGDHDATGRPTSFGAFQLHYRGTGRHTAAGLGEEFTRKTGLDARDPSTEADQIRFALDYAKTNGWGPWHGWKGLPFAGIGGIPPAGGAAAGGGTTTVQSTVSIGQVVVNTQAQDAGGIARDIKPALERNLNAAQSNYGQQ